VAAADPAVEEPIRVLVCDDDELFAQALAETLSRDARLEVVGVARHGREALEFAQTAGAVDVVLLDIEMPQVDGIETLRTLNEWPQRPAVMMLTGITDSEVIKRAEQEVPDAFLRKSVDPEEVVDGILIIRELVRAASLASA
jgi:DNA-binding NarL/FixJ family response regulator